MQHSLTTRYCPEHPGASIKRIDEATFQCPLDNKIYNYEVGFSTINGNVIPGTSVSGQTDVEQHSESITNYDTRYSKMGI